MATVPKTTTVATATATCSARPRITGSAAMTAAAPQMELPAPMSMAVFRSNLNTPVPSHHDSEKVLLNTRASMATPATPTWAISWNVSRKPYRTIPARSKTCFENSTPGPATPAARRYAVLPMTIPMTMATVRALKP